MATWLDLFALIVIGAIFVGVIVGVMKAAEGVSKAVDNTKQQLKNKGYTISDGGVSIKTSGRVEREDIVDAQQRGFIAAMGASSFGTADNVDKRPVVSRQTSLASVESTHTVGAGSSNLEREGSTKEKKSKFGLRKKSL